MKSLTDSDWSGFQNQNIKQVRAHWWWENRCASKTSILINTNKYSVFHDIVAIRLKYQWCLQFSTERIGTMLFFYFDHSAWINNYNKLVGKISMICLRVVWTIWDIFPVKCLACHECADITRTPKIRLPDHLVQIRLIQRLPANQQQGSGLCELNNENFHVFVNSNNNNKKNKTTPDYKLISPQPRRWMKSECTIFTFITGRKTPLQITPCDEGINDIFCEWRNETRDLWGSRHDVESKERVFFISISQFLCLVMPAKDTY